jgi:molybdenum cofactor cytidylyltransferase
MADSLSLGVVILAAGASSRMGQPKMLLPWRGTTILGHLISIWNELGASQIGVVINPEYQPLKAELERLAIPSENWIPNPNAKEGMFNSIQAAAHWPGWNPDITHFVIVLGDQPHLTEELLSSLLEFTSLNSTFICQPSYGLKGRHPVLFPKDLFLSLSQSVGPTLKDFLNLHRTLIRLYEWDDQALDFDIDTPEAYERARQVYE